MSEEKKDTNFIREIVDKDLETNKYEGNVHTRFPPEPNGYLHIGHAKSICLNFGIARDYKGLCNLRFDDTNPCKEEQEYVDSIIEDVKWLGFDWEDRLYYASDYFENLFECAIKLIEKGKAYVCDLSSEEMREYRGTLTESGKESPYRGRSIEENLELFQKMRAGEYEDGSRVLRAKIDMASSNLNMRDPIMYRIRREYHHRTKDKWCIYPMYDYAHCVSDSLEKITHSICTLEFENHRPLYDWFLKELEIHHSQQIEFARLNLGFTILSKRKLLELVQGNYVSGWDDPRMPTLSGLRRRGYTPESLRVFCQQIGVAKFNSIVDLVVLENSLRNHLNAVAPRAMAVLRPLKVVITNYPEDQEELLEAINNPEDEGMGTRKVPFSKELYIEQGDFLESPPKKFFRLTVGKEVRLRYAYFITCQEVIKNETTGEILQLNCTYDPLTKGGDAPDGRKVKGTLHWVSAKHALEAQVNLYDRLFTKRNPNEVDEGGDYRDNLNPNSLEVLDNCKLEPSLESATACLHYQFERLGYFCLDEKDSSPAKRVFNRSVSLKDSWEKIHNNK